MTGTTTSGAGTSRDGRWRVTRWLMVVGLLLCPWIAMQFTIEVRWSTLDFILMAALLGGAGLVFELAIWKICKPQSRLLVALGVVGAVLLVWVEGAVGIFN